MRATRSHAGRANATARLAVLGLLAAATAGCLEARVRHTLFVDAGGEVTWLVLEEDVRSISEDPLAREREEAAFLDAVERGTHDLALALEQAGGRRVRSEILRDRQPFVVATEARFGSLDEALEGLAGLGASDARAHLEERDGRRRLELAGRLMDEPSDAFVRMLLAEEIEIVLAEGTFVDAVGFALDKDGRRAHLLPLDEASRELHWELVWEP
jgi:hypothetical protein